jgi:Sulfotransferase family
MIISHQHRFIFFAVPKTGTHSVRQALREQLGEQDLEQVGLFVKKRFPFPEFANIPHGHISATEIRPVLGEQVFGEYLKFGFVRNPFDRFVSYCAFMARDTNYMETTPVQFMKHVIRVLNPVGEMLYRPQHTFLTHADGTLAMDVVGRNETMQASYDAICARLGMPSAELGRANASRHRPWQEYYDRDLIGWVSELYRKDLDLFDYRFE